LDYFALLFPMLIIAALLVALLLFKRRLFDEGEPPAPIPLPADLIPRTAEGDRSAPNPAAGSSRGEIKLTPARLYPCRPLNDIEKSVFASLLKALPGYVVLPKISYGEFLEARDGSVSENTSLRKRAAGHRADFIICDKKLRVLLVCQIDDGRLLPARIKERDTMLQKSGLRLLRWRTAEPPDTQALLAAVRKLEAEG